MPQFSYRGTNPDGSPTAGLWLAETLAEARQQLRDRGLTDVQLTLAEPPRPAPLDEGDFLEVLGHVRDVTASGLPLAAALRLLADDLPSRKQRLVLQSLSDRIAAGESLMDVLPTYGTSLPPAIAELAAAASDHQGLPTVLGEYVQRWQQAVELRRFAWLSLAYPLVLISLLLAISILLAWFIGPSLEVLGQQLDELGSGFGMTPTPGGEVTRPIMGWGLSVLATLRWILSPLGALFAAAAVVAVIILRRLGRGQVWSWIFYAIPLVGPMFRYARLSQFCHLWALLLECRSPLPRALRVAGAVVNCPPLAAGSAAIANGIESGRSAVEVARATFFMPQDLVPLMRWIDQPQELASMLRAAGEVFAARVKLQSYKLSVILQPLTLLAIGTLMGIGTIAFYERILSLTKLLNDLS